MAVLAVISVVRVPLGEPRATAEFMQPQNVPVKFAWQRTWSSREGCISLARALLVFHLTEKCEHYHRAARPQNESSVAIVLSHSHSASATARPDTARHRIGRTGVSQLANSQRAVEKLEPCLVHRASGQCMTTTRAVAGSASISGDFTHR